MQQKKEKDRSKDVSTIPKITFKVGKGGKLSVAETPKNSPKIEAAMDPKVVIPKL